MNVRFYSKLIESYKMCITRYMYCKVDRKTCIKNGVHYLDDLKSRIKYIQNKKFRCCN